MPAPGSWGRAVFKALLLAFALLCSDSAMAGRSLFQARCEDAPTQAVESARQPQADYVINNTQSYRALSALKGKAPAGAYVLGLTHVHPSFDIGHRGPVMRDLLQRSECLMPQIDVSLAYRPIVVYIGSEFVTGTCAYQEVLAHEMRHVNAYLNQLPKVEARVRKEMLRRFDHRPLYAPVGQSGELLRREIETTWIPFMTRLIGQIEQLQAAIDTPKEVDRLSRVCKGEVQSLIGPAD